MINRLGFVNLDFAIVWHPEAAKFIKICVTNTFLYP